ncbi:MAG: amino acid ABC transporter substrate-binding protein [Deltaproteobacteria bacterium]|nr:amino acid ABC transporter substrate-binding protein [Deltaproteobacteria bacterium]
MQKIKFGIPISLSGRYSNQGKESLEGLALWIKDVNGSGGIFVKEFGKKFTVELLYYDDESSTYKCKEIVERLIVKDKVDVLIGPYSSGLTLAAAPIAEEFKKILWNHGGSSDEIFESGSKYIVSTITSASKYFVGIIEMVKKIDNEARKITIFRAEDSGFSTNVAEGAKRYGEENGFRITELKYVSGTKDFSSLLKQVQENIPDLILGVGRAEDDLLLAKQIVENKVNAKAIGLVVAGIKEFHQTLGKDVEGFLGPSQWEGGIKIEPDLGPTPQDFFIRFKYKYGKEPDYTAAQSYNIGPVIQKCIEDAGTLDDYALREAASRADFKTFYGHFKIDQSTGTQIGHKMVIVQWRNGNKVIVYPEEIAESRPVYPKLIS